MSTRIRKVLAFLSPTTNEGQTSSQEDELMKDYRNKESEKQYSIEIARSLEEVEALRSIWEGWQWHPNADIDFYRTIVTSRPEILQPHVILLLMNGKAKAMMVGRIEDHRFEIKIGYKVVFAPKMRVLRIVYGGVLGEQSDITARIVICELMNELRKREVDAIFFDDLQTNSVIYQIAKTKPGFFCRDYTSFTNPHWKMALPNSIDEFFRRISRNRREELRRFPRLLEKNYVGKVTFRCIKEREKLDQLCKDVEEVARKTYQRGLGVGFINNEENQRRLALEAEKGWLRAYLLYVEEKPCAFWIGTFYKNVFHSNFMGFDTHYKSYKPGMVVFSKMIDDLCKSGAEGIDFGLGGALYKERFGDQKWEEACVAIFAPTIKCMGINAAMTIVTATSQCAKLILEKTNLLGKIKRIWRDRLSQSIRNDNGNS